MASPLAETLAAIADRLFVIVSEDEVLRGHLRRLGHVILAAVPETEATPGEQDSGGGPSRDADVESPSIQSTTSSDESETFGEFEPKTTFGSEPDEPLPELTFAPLYSSSNDWPESYSRNGRANEGLEFEDIRANCVLKAEGVRWAVARRRFLDEGADFATIVQPMDRDLISRAKQLPECFLWMCHPSAPAVSNVDDFEVIARCYENMEQLLGLLRRIEEGTDAEQRWFEPAIRLLAEAQSALRKSILEVSARDDGDQFKVFNWLKQVSSEEKIYIGRYMRADDAADPSNWADLGQRIEKLEAEVGVQQQRGKQNKKLLGKIRHKAGQLSGDAATDEPLWDGIIESVEQLIEGGLPASHRDLREFLLPKLDSLPDREDFPEGFRQVLREFDRYLANPPAAEIPRTPSRSSEVDDVARRLAGKKIFMICGERKPWASDALKTAFGLDEVIWFSTRDHSSIDRFEPDVARPDVAVVIVAIRWSSHSYGEVKDFCDRHGKPFVRLPGGYSPNQVAKAILDQCSERLPIQ